MAAWPPGGAQTQQGVLGDSENRPVACGEGCCEGHLSNLLGAGCQQTDKQQSAVPGEATIRKREIKNPKDQAPSHLHIRNQPLTYL